MSLALLLAMILGASMEPVTSAGLITAGVNTVVGGFISNRADASLWWGCQTLAKGLGAQDARPMQEVLGKALWLSYLQALKSVCSECKAELLIDKDVMTYRGQPNYPAAVRADAQWLDNKLSELTQKITNIERGDLSDVPEIDVQALASFVEPTDGQSETGVALRQAAATKLVRSTYTPDMLPLYKDKLNQFETGLFERICDFFAQQLANDSALQIFFENQLLLQINSEISGQSITLQQVLDRLQELSHVVPQQLDQAIEKLDSVEAVQTETNDRSILILQEVREVKAQIEILQPGRRIGGDVSEKAALSPGVVEPNPFNLLSGRIDDPTQLFGRQRLINNIFDVLNSGSSVAMIGDRQSGKSSILKAIELKAKSQLNIERKPIYIDLQLAPNEDDFYEVLCHHAEIAVEKGFRLTRALRQKRLLLLLDGLEKMALDGFTEDIRSRLRGLAEGIDAPLQSVVAASEPLDQLFSNSKTSPVEGIYIEEPIEPWDEATIKAFLADRLQHSSICFSDAEVSKIIDDSKGNPRQVTVLCYQQYRHYQRSQ